MSDQLNEIIPLVSPSRALDVGDTIQARVIRGYRSLRPTHIDLESHRP